MGSTENRHNVQEQFSQLSDVSSYTQVFPSLTVFRKRELEHRGDEEGQGAFRVIDFSTALTEPPCLRLVSDLIEAAILSCHEDATQVCGGDGQDVGVVCGD